MSTILYVILLFLVVFVSLCTIDYVRKINTKSKNMFYETTKDLIPKSPQLKTDLPLGYGSTYAGPYSTNAGCSNNVNGIMKMQKQNRYGEMYPDGKQMYAYCVKGSNNPF